MIHESARAFAGSVALGAVAPDARLRARDHEADVARLHRPSAPALPPDLAALERAGLPPGPLHAALAEARTAGVEAFDALLASGAFDEATLVEALARAIGVDIAGPEDAAAGSIDADEFALASAAGHLAALDNAGAPRFVMAARGAATRRLAASRRGQPRTRSIALAGPQAFSDIAVARAGQSLATRASEGPGRTTPELTVAGGMPPIGPLSRIAIAVALAALLAAALAIPSMGDALLVLLGLLFAASNLFRLVLSVTAPTDRRCPPRAPDASLPVYTVLVALYREGAVVPALLDALERLDYPAAKLDIKILTEEDDIETHAALALRPPRAGIEVLRLPAGGPKTKPRALNAGLLCAHGEFLTVYDAEDRPDPAQLRLAVDAFRRGGPALACLQARLAIDNLRDGWLVRQFAIEYAALFDVVLPALSTLRLPIPLGGTSNHFRASVLRRLGGWDAGNVTEDADLGLRLAREGWRTETLCSTTWEEAPITPRAWIKQRTRWMKGYMATAVVHGRKPRRLFERLGPAGFLASQLLIGGVALTALAYPVVVATILWTGLSGSMFAPATSLPDAGLLGFHVANLIVGFSAGLACGWIGIDRRCPQRFAADLFSLPLYWMLIGVAAWRALGQILLGETMCWEKTMHGVSRRRERKA